MKSRERSKRRFQIVMSLGVLAIALCLLTNALMAGEDTTPQKPSPPPKKAEKKPPPKKLTGAELYALHCNRCHAERYAPERTADQWKTILLHMRTRANLPAEQAKAVLQFLQEDSGK